MLPESDRTRLRHMLEAACEATGYVEDKTRADLENERQLQHSLVRCIEIIGEASAKLSSDFRHAHTQLPWQDLVGMRNRLIHAYFDIDLDVIWQTATEELPVLIAAVRVILAEKPDSSFPADAT